MDIVVWRGGIPDAPHREHRNKSILLDTTHADPPAPVHQRGGSADEDGSGVSASEARKRRHHDRHCTNFETENQEQTPPSVGAVSFFVVLILQHYGGTQYSEPNLISKNSTTCRFLCTVYRGSYSLWSPVIA